MVRIEICKGFYTILKTAAAIYRRLLQSIKAAAGRIGLAGPLVACSVWSALSWGDDIDIYFNSASINDLGLRPNILFILDTSGSMQSSGTGLTSISLPNNDAVRRDLEIGNNTTSRSKIFHMKRALYDFLNDSVLAAEINVGLMRFNHEGAAVVYPVSPLDDHQGELVSTLRQMRVGDTQTPIVDSLYEAALYYSGGYVYRGLNRGSRGDSSRFRDSRYTKEYRISHPDSVVSGSGAYPFFPNGCSVLNLNDTDCRYRGWAYDNRYLRLNQQRLKYKSPISHQCQPNYIVLLTDGAATVNYAKNRVSALTGVARADCDASGNRQCGVDLTRYLATQDQIEDAALPGDQTVKTHVIGFNFSTSWLEDLATAGGGEYHTADSASELSGVLARITRTVLNVDTTFTAPVATINQFNRLNHKEEVYFAVFRPESTRRWPGNVKKYKLAVVDNQRNVVVDASGAAAIDPATGFFKGTSKDFFDGSVGTPSEFRVEDGGVGMKLGTTARKVYTWLSGNPTTLTSAVNKLHEDNTAINKDMLGIADDPGSSDDENERTAVLQWARGYDAANNTYRREVGAPLHSRPVVVSYSDSDAKVFFGTNEGYLHAFDAEDGSDQFSFIPEELLGNLRPQYKGFEGDHIYGVDGPITFWTFDADPDDEGPGKPDGEIKAGGDDKAYLFFGMRRGGSSYYALDVTNPASPSVLWRIKSGDTGFEELGQSWSRPIKTVVKINTGTAENPVPEDKHVLFISGGYDEDQDADAVDAVKTRAVDNIGRALYMVSAETGNLLWKADIADYPAMKYSIPATPAVADTDQSGTADQIYVGDMGGQVWRFDIDNGAPLPSTDESYYGDNFIKGGVIADLAGSAADNNVASARRFYHSPDVALTKQGTNTFVAVTIGSGWRAKPNDKEVTDRFYMLRVTSPYSALDFNSFTTITEDRMADLTNTIGTAASAAVRGASSQSWYITMENTGEKVLSTPLTIGGNVIFTSYEPSAGLVNCVPTPGTSRQYIVNLADATPVVDFDVSGDLSKSDRSKQLQAGTIVDEPVLIFTEDGGSVFVGTEKSGVEIENRATRTFWYKEE